MVLRRTKGYMSSFFLYHNMKQRIWIERTLVLVPVVLCWQIGIVSPTFLALFSMIQTHFLSYQTSTTRSLRLNNILYSLLFSCLVVLGETSNHMDRMLLFVAAIASHLATMFPYHAEPRTTECHVSYAEWAVLGMILEVFLCIWFAPAMTTEHTLSIWFFILMVISCFIIHRYHDLFHLQFTYLEYYMFIVMVGLIWEYVVLENRFHDMSVVDVSNNQDIPFGYATVVDVASVGILCTVSIMTLTVVIGKFIQPSTTSTHQTYRIVIFLTLFTMLSLLIFPCSFAAVLGTRHTGGVDWILDFLTKDDHFRFHLCGLWIAMICVGGSVAWTSITHYHWSTVSSRKIFHILIMAIILSGLLIDSTRTFIVLAVCVACCGFIVLETFRIVVLISNHSSLRVATGDPLSTFYRHFIDDKDLDRHWLSAHFHLLIGCAIPIVLKGCWESAVWRATRNRSREMLEKQEWILPTLLHHTPLLPHLGWIVVGVGDSVAAMIGTKYGKHFWLNTKRSVEGSIGMLLSMIMATLFTYIFLCYRGNITITMRDIVSSLLTLLATTFMEAFTNESDNLILPLFACALYIILVRIHLL